MGYLPKGNSQHLNLQFLVLFWKQKYIIYEKLPKINNTISWVIQGFSWENLFPEMLVFTNIFQNTHPSI